MAKLVSAYLKDKRKAYQTGGYFKDENQIQSLNPQVQTNPGISSGSLNAGITGAASIGTSLIESIEPANDYGTTSDGAAVGKGALKGAATGAAAGSVIGPWGTVIGGAIGGIAGGISGLVGNNKAQALAEKAKRRKHELDAAKSIQESNAILASYDNQGTGITSFKKGGILYSYPAVWTENPLKFKKSKYTFQQGGKLELENNVQANGGELQPISDTSFEVVGNNPGATDDVQVENAFLDHGEVVQPTNDGMKIYSDTLKVPGSNKTFAEASKKLEKQKTSNSTRFPKQDMLVQAKQDELFNLQQALNNNNTGESPEEGLVPAGRFKGVGFKTGNMFQVGGLSKLQYPVITGNPRYDSLLSTKQAYIDSRDNISQNPYTDWNNHLRTNIKKIKAQDLKLMQDKLKYKNSLVSAIQPQMQPALSSKSPFANLISSSFQQGGFVDYIVDEDALKPKKNPYTALDVLGHLGTIAPVFANMAAANKLPDVPAPVLNKTIQLQKANYGDQQVALKQGLRTAMEASRLNSVNPNAQAAGVSNSLAKYLGATNQMYGDINRQNASINNQQALINANVMAGNTNKLDNYNAGVTARAANILGLKSQNRADLSNKLMGIISQENQKKLDAQKNAMFLEYINKVAPGLSDRNEYLNAAAGNFKKGGRMLRSKKYC